MHNRKREESIPLVYHPCAKFTRGQLHANMSELACGQQICTNHIHSVIDGHTTLIVEWGVDLLWQMQFHTLVLTTLKGHEPLPGMVYSTYAEWDALLSPLLYVCICQIH